jgi:SOS-response transcriptional repressor LexA
MTNRQHAYYHAIRSFLEKNHRSPTFGEIGRMVGVNSLATVHRIVHRMIELGYLTRTPGTKYMNLEIVPQKMLSMNSCNRSHVPVWFMTRDCPLCEALARVRGIAS